MYKPKSRDNKDVLLTNYPYLPIIHTYQLSILTNYPYLPITPLKVETFLHLPIIWYDIGLELFDDAFGGHLYLLNDKTQSLKV